MLSQLVHIPLNWLIGQAFATGVVPMPSERWHLPVFSAIAGFTAGLCEEGARFAVLRWWARDIRSWRGAVLLGAGHGGMEAILVGLLVLVNLMAMVAYRSVDLSSVVPAEQLEAATRQIAAYWSAEWPSTLLGAVERALTLPVQIGLTVLVAQAFIRPGHRGSGLAWLAVAVLWHAVIDAVVAGYLASLWLPRGIWGAIALEGALALVSGASIALTLALRMPDPPEQVPAQELLPEPIPVPLAPPAETPENLEATRYDH